MPSARTRAKRHRHSLLPLSDLVAHPQYPFVKSRLRASITFRAYLDHKVSLISSLGVLKGLVEPLNEIRRSVDECQYELSRYAVGEIDEQELEESLEYLRWKLLNEHEWGDFSFPSDGINELVYGDLESIYEMIQVEVSGHVES